MSTSRTRCKKPPKYYSFCPKPETKYPIY
uniref:Uncharacterized protein n=1 Tax=Arundo donax TaxID=35708 RepID=A0A0A9AK72_ARUDO